MKNQITNDQSERMWDFFEVLEEFNTELDFLMSQTEGLLIQKLIPMKKIAFHPSSSTMHIEYHSIPFLTFLNKVEEWSDTYHNFVEKTRQWEKWWDELDICPQYENIDIFKGDYDVEVILSHKLNASIEKKELFDNEVYDYLCELDNFFFEIFNILKNEIEETRKELVRIAQSLLLI